MGYYIYIHLCNSTILEEEEYMMIIFSMHACIPCVGPASCTLYHINTVLRTSLYAAAAAAAMVMLIKHIKIKLGIDIG